LKRVYSSFNQTAVYHAQNLLETAGIRTTLRNQMLSSAMGELPPAECQMELWVVEDSDLENAAQILAARPAAGPEWTCACGEKLGPQFTQCWKCGAYRRES